MSDNVSYKKQAFYVVGDVNAMKRNIFGDDCVFLAQTDTTVGFLSKNPLCINQKKGAKELKPLLQEVSALRNIPTRIPVLFRKIVRRAKKTSFIMPNNISFRVIQEDLHGSLHRKFLHGFIQLYSSSANKTGQDFCSDFAYNQADVVVCDKRGIFASKGSHIVKLRQGFLKKIR